MSGAPTPLPPATAPAPGVWRTIEGTTGAFFAFVVGFVVVVMGGNFAYLAHGSPEFPVVLAAVVAVSAAEIWWLARLKDALERGQRPLAPVLAITQPRWPLLVRPLAAAWWLAHYAVGVAAILLLERYFPLSSGDLRVAALRWLAYAACLFTTTHSAHLYLLLAVGSTLTHRPGPVLWLWKWRVAIDLLILFAAAGSRIQK